MPIQHAGIECIVVGVDGSKHSESALRWAGRMAKGMGSEVVAVFAIAPPMYIDSGYLAPIQPPQRDPAWRDEMKKELEEWCKPLQEVGVRYRAIMEDGRPASVIVQVADTVDADVIVVGRRGRGGVAELVLGSVSHELVLHARRPVLLIPRAPAAAKASTVHPES